MRNLFGPNFIHIFLLLTMPGLLYSLNIKNIRQLPTGMTINRAILATDTHPDYIAFWPLVAKAWTQLIGVRPTLALIAPPDVPIDETLGDVIRFEPIPGIPTSLQAQTIRLLLPALFPDDVCITSDIDMLPISRSYFIDPIAYTPLDHLIIYRDAAFGPNAERFPMCYIAAKGYVFQEIFGLTSKEEIPNIIKKWNSFGLGWNTDELVMYQYLKNWHGFKNRCTRYSTLNHPPVERIDRARWGFNPALIASGYYTEAHMPRPYARYQGSLGYLAQLLGIK